MKKNILIITSKSCDKFEKKRNLLWIFTYHMPPILYIRAYMYEFNTMHICTFSEDFIFWLFRFSLYFRSLIKHIKRIR
jgi:hypothetical protein